MKIKTLALGVLALINSNVNAQCVSNQDNVYSFTYNGNLYKIVKESQDWLYAQSCANNEGGYLAQIDSQEEQEAIFSQVNLAGITASSTVAPDGGNGSYLWLGGADISIEGQWNWLPYGGTAISFWQGTGASGSAVGGLYNNWGGNGSGTEPDNYGSGQDALGFAFTDWPLGLAGQWNDVAKANNLYYIIEYNGLFNGIENNTTNSTLECYPNPANETVTIKLPENSVITENLNISIFNIQGALIKEVKLNSNKQSINTKDFSEGVYILKTNTIGIYQKPIKLTITK